MMVLTQFNGFGFSLLAEIIIKLVNFSPILKILAVLILFPILGNTLQFLIQDYILKMKNVHESDYEIVSKYYETVLERESHYQEFRYFNKQKEMELSNMADKAVL